jgi:hypothetical protein
MNSIVLKEIENKIDALSFQELLILLETLTQKLKSKEPQAREIAKKENSFDPSTFRGIYKNRNIDLENEMENLRDEWTRTF